VLLLSGAVLDDAYRPVPSGLEPIARAGGIELGADILVERAPELRLPSGVGERFFALPEEHPVTAGLRRGPRPDQRAFFSVAQSVRPTAAGSPTPLVTTSAQSFAVSDLRRFLEGERVEPGKRDRLGPLSVAMASELAKPPGSSAPHGPRLVVFGSGNIAQNQSFRDPVLLGNRRLIENAVSWLAAQPALVSVPEKAGAELGVALTEESLTEVWRYVILYLPGTALLLGVLVLVRRRGRERRSRREAERPRPGPRPHRAEAVEPSRRAAGPRPERDGEGRGR
jgi:hypothetical protein